MSIVAHTYPFVIGVDTHARTHTLAVLTAAGEELACEQFPTTAAGISRAITWAGRRTGGDLGALWAIEGIGSYGAQLAREVADTGYEVAEAPRMDARARRGAGKSDPLKAAQIREVSQWRTRKEDLATATARDEAVRLAGRITALDETLKEDQKRMTQLIQASPAAPLLDETGIGPRPAAVVITVWSHLGRVRSEAAFAALAGVNPIPASSGNTTRHRLNRGGDRRLNHALHTAAMTRMRCDPETRAYAERRLAEGRTTREIRRCIKRYLARHLYRTLNALHTPPATT